MKFFIGSLLLELLISFNFGLYWVSVTSALHVKYKINFISEYMTKYRHHEYIQLLYVINI